MTRDVSIARVLLLLLSASFLSACAGERPSSATCPAVTGLPAQPFDAALDDAVAARWAGPPGAPHNRVAILVLSGGGAWGAYGAGFLNGWAQRRDHGTKHSPSRPTFDIVTGVSTGAIMAPFALLGSGSDPSLESAFRGVSGEDLFSGRSVLGLPWWNSLKEPDGLERRLLAALDDTALASLRTAAGEKRTVWVGAVNFDTGQFTEFNLSAIARDLPNDQARTQIADHIMAASAVPAFFPPRFINGCMFMDGGVRENVFVTPLQTATTVHESRADIYVIENGPIEVPPLLTKNNLRDIATRGFDLAESQIQLNSLRNIYQYAREHGYGFYWTSADDVVYNPDESQVNVAPCKAPKTPADQFEATFTACLFDAASRKAHDGITPWRTDKP